jgi:light-harvesting protein B-800-850 alpha chain
MNQGRIWCVVHPTVGLPLFLGSVALTALAVHTAVLTHTTWFGNYWQGSKARAAMNASAASVASLDNPAFTISVAPASANSGKTDSFVVTVTPKADTAPHAVSLAAAK